MRHTEQNVITIVLNGNDELVCQYLDIETDSDVSMKWFEAVEKHLTSIGYQIVCESQFCEWQGGKYYGTGRFERYLGVVAVDKDEKNVCEADIYASMQAGQESVVNYLERG